MLGLGFEPLIPAKPEPVAALPVVKQKRPDPNRTPPQPEKRSRRLAGQGSFVRSLTGLFFSRFDILYVSFLFLFCSRCALGDNDAVFGAI